MTILLQMRTTMMYKRVDCNMQTIGSIIYRQVGLHAHN